MANQFLIKNSMKEMKKLSPNEIVWLQGAYPVYSVVKILGYYSAGDTPEPIIYYPSTTDPSADDGGSVIFK